MDEGFGAPPKSGWAKLVAEILVEDIAVSLAFWRDVLGFEIAYRRPAETFAYLDLEGAQIMLSQRSGKWETGPMDRPHGRGVMFQLYVDALDPVLAALEAAAWPIYSGPREVWRRTGTIESGQREVFVQDPDGYLVMVAQNIGQRPLQTAP